jgi:hypothetical protein
MALSSGMVGSGLIREGFRNNQILHVGSGAQYRVSEGYLLTFRRGDEIQGSRRLGYYIGSGAVGRSYAYLLNGYLFQSPVAYYSAATRWDMSPGYASERRMVLSRPVETRCLECHASRLQPIAGTQNGYEKEPFLEGGIGCERCHGPGRQHVANNGRTPMVNPAKLPTVRRDSVCARCHLTGAVRIARENATPFEPGAHLADSVSVFVWEGQEQGRTKATGHFEQLWRSGCKQRSGDRLWCGSCHDPHSVPAAAQRVSYFRARCRTCHDDTACKLQVRARATNGNDCVACHMPRTEAEGMNHVAFTDHSIPRAAGRRSTADAPGRQLRLFWGGDPGARDLGLAYAELATKENDTLLRNRSFELLRQAQSQAPRDAKLLVQLATLYDRLGDEDRAMELYEEAAQADPDLISAAINLGSCYAKRGRIPEAMRLWQNALKKNPALESAGLNLGVAQARSGDIAAARTTLQSVLDYNPDSAPVRKLLAELSQ